MFNQIDYKIVDRTDLPTDQFRNALAIRYGCELKVLPTTCETALIGDLIVSRSRMWESASQMFFDVCFVNADTTSYRNHNWTRDIQEKGT